MNRYLFAATFLAFFTATTVTRAEERDRGERGDKSAAVHVRKKAVAKPAGIIKMRRHDIPRPDTVRELPGPEKNERRFRAPRQDGEGARITQRAAVAPPSHHAAIVRDPLIGRNIEDERRVEVVPNRYYWHTVNGVRYSHFYDNQRHWYGFYHGPAFYWTTFHNDRWWWHDDHFNRWTYWWDGYWWWAGPAGAMYVYVDNDYYPYNERGVTVKIREEQAAPTAVPAPDAGRSWMSPDGKRMVQVYGDDAQTFLYNQTADGPVFMKYLGKGVSGVRFSGGSDGKPLRILADFKDGSFAFFTAKGDTVDEDPSAVAAPPAPPPDATPPPAPN